MKKTLLFFTTTLITLTSFGQWQGFENWNSNTIQSLDDYQTSINDWGAEGAAATYPSNDAVTGALSVRLETVLGTAGDTIFGYFLSGDADSLTPGQAVSLTGVDSIIGYYKYDIMAGDSAGLIVGTTFSGTLTGGGTWYVTGQQTTWKRFAYYVNAPLADSLLLAAATGDPLNNFNGIPGSWIQFDDIQLKYGPQTQNVLNSGFENWSPVILEDPAGWQTGNMWAFGEPTMPAVKSTDSYAGTYAIELNTILNSNGDTVPGIATNGMIGFNGTYGGEPYTASPIGIECYYKSSPAAGDTAFISVQFKSGGSVIATYGGAFGNTVTNYTQWSQAISPTVFPDSVLVTLWAGNNPSSQFIVDNFDFQFTVGVAEGLTVEKLVAYPNPATDELRIKFNIENNNNVSVRLIDALGKELTNRNLGNLSAGTYRESFNTSEFSTGVYFIEFTLDNEKLTKRFMVK